MKTFLACLMIAFGVQGAQIKYYDDYPNNANPPTTYIISLQTNDKTVGGTPYNFWTLSQMVAWLQLRGFTNGSSTSITIITNNSFLYTTNLTIQAHGGATNLNLTPKSVMWSDVNDAEASIPNASGVLTNNGSGGIGFSQTLSLTEIDAQNFFPTNLFTGITNAPLLSTTSDGLLAATTYKYTTNIVGAANFVFGKAYWTNITGNFTFPALTRDATTMETLAVWVTNSGASTFTATINGVSGAPGHVVPAVFYCTNATVTEIDLSHFGVLWTNACVSKN